MDELDHKFDLTKQKPALAHMEIIGTIVLRADLQYFVFLYFIAKVSSDLDADVSQALLVHLVEGFAAYLLAVYNFINTIAVLHFNLLGA